jgi:superoxide dismutase, Cu-Zn family
MSSRTWVVLALAATVPAAAATPTRALALVRPTQGSTVEGQVEFAASRAGVRVSVALRGLTPGKHGFHIHEFGDCGAADGTSAGGHFNPGGEPHAGPTDTARHTGDLGNVEADKDGVVAFSYVDVRLAFDGPNSILGRGVIVHAKADDLKTQPTGDAGGRQGCGVIGAAKDAGVPASAPTSTPTKP